MIRFFKNLAHDPLNTLADWQDTRWPWGIIAAAMIAMVLVAHYIFQEWFFMHPCEQCVFIRYGNLVIALGAIIAMINPKAVLLKLAGYVVSIYGLIYTTLSAVHLAKMHHAVHSDDMDDLFGMQGGSSEPAFPFGLPLGKWAPSWFKPTGDCGYDAPIVPRGAELSDIQAYFIHLYQSADGWYLIPQWKFMDTASCCLLACAVVAIFLVLMLIGWGYQRFRQ